MDNFYSIEFHFEEVNIAGFNSQAITKWILDTISLEKQQAGVLNFVFCNDDYLLDLNTTYLGHDTLTDIITFDYNDEIEGISGDIFISIDRVRENAASLGVAFYDELCRVIIHGVLHLMGYMDKTPEQEALMREKENYCLTLRS